ncbi:uncharacterized protein EDB91DRAFT_1252159 [Suillus paluster]|uniref:uncharacterized protein n=1 Tax=Suillus paluster TaxID=48578 RepID=UPI001B866D1C|nr:uncharacterized protein EDB91DRAFT_1252159 [Suillus paluster]KAG1731522.1 hypothetical protein EDB91DRAFT_1252159 [Suillus paluster]
MCASISASQWGSPTASRRALLIHGMTASSISLEGIAQLLTAKGFFVVAPNLLGHAWRRGTDYRVSALAEDLRPYMDTSYDRKDTTVILLDPVLEVAAEQIEIAKCMFVKKVASVKTAEEYMADKPAWSRRDCVSESLGASMCDCTVIEGIFEQTKPWSFSGLFKNIPPNVNITVLASDPKFGAACRLEHVPRDVERLNARVLPGVGHCIQYERPDAIMDAIPLLRAEL